MSQPTVQVPLQTIEKLAALGKAMQSLADDMRRHVETTVSQPIDIPLPDLTRPETIPEGEAWFWAEDWLAGEKEVNEQLKRGEYKTYNSVEEAIHALHQRV